MPRKGGKMPLRKLAAIADRVPCRRRDLLCPLSTALDLAHCEQARHLCGSSWLRDPGCGDFQGCAFAVYLGGQWHGGEGGVDCDRRSGAEGMFTIVRKFTLTRGSAEEVTRRVQASFVPLLRELPGFREYFLFGGGPDVLVSIRVFESREYA